MDPTDCAFEPELYFHPFFRDTLESNGSPDATHHLLTASLRFLLRHRLSPNYVSDRSPPQPHRFHPTNPIWRFLGLYLLCQSHGHRVHHPSPPRPHRHHLLHRPVRFAAVPPPLAHRWLGWRIYPRGRLRCRYPSL